MLQRIQISRFSELNKMIFSVSIRYLNNITLIFRQKNQFQITISRFQQINYQVFGMTINIRTTVQKNLTQSNTINLLKHKITVNQVKQTHFSVQGVQTYSFAQVKALKVKEDPNYQNKQGQFIKPKVVLLSDQVFDEDQQNQKKKEKRQQDRPKTVPPKPKGQFKSNARNSVSMNNQQAVKLQKQLTKKSQLQRKLDKLKKKYKGHFEGIDFKQQTEKEPVKIIHNSQNASQQQKGDNFQEIQENQSKIESECGNLSSDLDNSKVSKRSQKQIPSGKKMGRKSKKTEKNTKDESSNVKGKSQKQDFEDAQIDWTKKGINFLGQVMQKSTYSQRLGTAVHSLFN